MRKISFQIDYSAKSDVKFSKNSRCIIQLQLQVYRFRTDHHQRLEEIH